MSTPSEQSATNIAKHICALARAIDMTSAELTAAHSALLSAIEAAPSGPGWQWMAQESFIEAMREATRTGMKVGCLLIACEEAQDAFRH